MIQTKTECFLCADLSDRAGAIAQTDKFRLLADLSPLTAMHLLIAPIKHSSCFLGQMRDLCFRDRALEMMARVMSATSRKGLFVEHGALGDIALERGVTHAHLHYYGEVAGQVSGCTLSESLAQAVGRDASRWLHLDELIDAPRASTEFFWVFDPEEAASYFIEAPASGGKQLLRKCMCGLLGRSFQRYEDEENQQLARYMTSHFKPVFSSEVD